MRSGQAVDETRDGAQTTKQQAELHKRILVRGRISSKHHAGPFPMLIRDPNTWSDEDKSVNQNLLGRATRSLFESIISRRQYDTYCRPVKGASDSNDSGFNSERRYRSIKVKPAHRSFEDIQAEAEAAYRERHKEKF